jgi:hypothetical protein
MLSSKIYPGKLELPIPTYGPAACRPRNQERVRAVKDRGTDEHVAESALTSSVPGMKPSRFSPFWPPAPAVTIGGVAAPDSEGEQVQFQEW